MKKTKFYPTPFGHIEVRIDCRPARSPSPRWGEHCGPVEGARGNPEVPPWQLDELERDR
jgi:hypothetical protein